MSDFDAYEDMRWTSGPTDREIERVLSGRCDGDETLAELAEFVSDVREAYGAPPAAAVAERHLALIASAAARQAAEPGSNGAADIQDASRMSRRTFMPTRKRIGRATIALALVGGVVTGSLAAAGVDMPILPPQASDEARDAVARAAERREQRGESGAQPEQSPPAFLQELGAVLESVPPEERGCEFGQRVATIASGGDPTEGDPCAARNQTNGGGQGQQNNGGGQGQQNAGGGQGQQDAGGGQGGGEQANPGRGGRETGNQASGGIAGEAQGGGVEGGRETGNQASGGVAGQAQSGGLQGGHNIGEQASGGVSSDAGAPAPQAGGGAGGAHGPPAELPPAAQPGQNAAANAPAGPKAP
jgi:hypothetical protein